MSTKRRSTRRRSHCGKASPRPNLRASGIRYVTSEARDVFDAAQVEVQRRMCRALETATEPLDAERLASRLHGRMWEIRRQATTPKQPDWSFGLGAPFARQLARIGGPGAKALLLTLGFQAPARLGALCAELASDLDAPMPDWARAVPRAQLTRAALSEAQAIRIVALEFRREPHQPFAIVVMIKHGIAARYGLVRPFDELAARGTPDGSFSSMGITFLPMEIDDARRQAGEAIKRADAVEPRLLDIASAKELRALALSRIHGFCPGPRAPDAA